MKYRLGAINHAIGEHAFGGMVRFSSHPEQGNTNGDTYPLFATDFGAALTEVWKDWGTSKTRSLRVSLLILKGLGMDLKRFEETGENPK